jgi:peptidase M48-like protein
VSGAKRAAFPLSVLLCALLCIVSTSGQQTPNLEIPPQFKLDLETAARLEPRLQTLSIAPDHHYAIARLVFDRLVQQVVPVSSPKIAWQLRIVEEDQLNAYSSPSGSIFVEAGLAKLAGSSTGLWAAILSHEIAHVTRRDWARRYLYQKKLENGATAGIVLGDPSLPSSSWTDSEKASGDMGRFCRQMEVEADREGLMLMARAGYHPDFVPALHHLLHAGGRETTKVSLYAMHPCWEERDRELSRAYVQASVDFEHRWLEWYTSPGGDPPVLVFADEPKVQKIGASEWRIQVPMRCQNLAGAVEVVLRGGPEIPSTSHDDSEMRQLTGCTSPKTTVTFNVAGTEALQKARTYWRDVYVLDAWGTVLARTELPRLPH